MWLYATLPFLLQGILAIVTIFAGLDADSFNLKESAGRYQRRILPAPPMLDSPKWLMAGFGTSIDILTIWVLILLTIGCAIVGKMKTSTAAVAVWGWWILITLVKVGIAGMF